MDLSIRDELTGVYNYTYFQDLVKQEADKANRSGKSFSVVRFDIDNFQEINQKYGFDFGNIIIRQFADLNKNSTRGGDVIARVEAEIFVVLLPEVALNDAMIFAERIRTRTENREDFGEPTRKVQITVSGGIVTYSRKQLMDLTQMFQLLDASVYQAKQDGRNCIVPFTQILPPEESSFI